MADHDRNGTDFYQLVDIIEASEAEDLGIENVDDFFATDAVPESTARRVRTQEHSKHFDLGQEYGHGSIYSFEDR